MMILELKRMASAVYGFGNDFLRHVAYRNEGESMSAESWEGRASFANWSNLHISTGLMKTDDWVFAKWICKIAIESLFVFAFNV